VTSPAQTIPDLQPFDDASAIRRVHLEGVLLLGGGRALLMQLAHPAVAQGVADHSDFSRDPIGRLLRTLRPMLAIAYGSPEEVGAAAGGVNAIHRRVNGGYDARDPALLLWVLATLIDTTLVMQERFLRPLSPSFAESYYQDMLTVGELLGVERRSAPPDLESFQDYVEETTSTLRVSDTARRIARQVLGGPRGTGPFIEPLRQLTAGLLPPVLREQFGLSWGPQRQTALRAAQSLSRTLLPYIPRRLRYTPGLLLPPSWKARQRSRKRP
jgi:uncharacterized protein (DUF2236 family)